MNCLWLEWAKKYDLMVEELIGTRMATECTWGRKYNKSIRTLCKKASISRSWFVKAKIAGKVPEKLQLTWTSDRKQFIKAWEQSEKAWVAEKIQRALHEGGIAVWKLLGGVCKDSVRPLLVDELIVTDPTLIARELVSHHAASLRENITIPAGDFTPVLWEKKLKVYKDLKISDSLVVNSIRKLKNSAVPDRMRPEVIKLLFGHGDTVGPLSNMIRAVARTRVFPEGGKMAKQVFVWKGNGERNKLSNCRTITIANIIHKLAESCIKDSAEGIWAQAGFPRPYWGHFFGAPESLYIWVSTVEKYLRGGEKPITILTDVSRAFDRVHHELYKKKLVDYRLPTQLIQLIMKFMSGLQVNICWRKAKTKLLSRCDVGAPQGSLGGMWNFGVYSDNIHDAIAEAISGVLVGGEVVTEVGYADDITPVCRSPKEADFALKAIQESGTFNAFKFKPTKCKIIGMEQYDVDSFQLALSGVDIERSEVGILLGAVIMSSGISPYEYVKRRAKMIKKGLKQIKTWRTKGLPFEVAFSKLVRAKLLPRFCYGFGLLPVTRWSKAHIKIQKTLDAALKQTFDCSNSKGTKLLAGVWFAICGHPSVLGFLRQEKLLMAARLKIAQTKAGRIFRGLFGYDNGTFESDVSSAVKGWLLGKDWHNLDKDNILQFRKKVKRRARKCWPHGLRRDGNLKWLYHNHCVYS